MSADQTPSASPLPPPPLPDASAFEADEEPGELSIALLLLLFKLFGV